MAFVFFRIESCSSNLGTPSGARATRGLRTEELHLEMVKRPAVGAREYTAISTATRSRLHQFRSAHVEIIIHVASS